MSNRRRTGPNLQAVLDYVRDACPQHTRSVEQLVYCDSTDDRTMALQALLSMGFYAGRRYQRANPTLGERDFAPEAERG